MIVFNIYRFIQNLQKTNVVFKINYIWFCIWKVIHIFTFKWFVFKIIPYFLKEKSQKN